MAKEKLICNVCGAEMNNHAEKISYEARAGANWESDPDFGGLLEEIHTCPKCGGVEATLAIE
ncbi:MAG: hypothetical protein KC473_04500 [Candidatus Dadabacteria bacterium]|nr:hypothetical protein [Candidatus Dadabacteria bacterium]